MYDRDPREAAFRLNHRILAFFAVDLYEAVVTTKLDGEKTSFLPFNQGSNGAGADGGAGNPQTGDNDYVTGYVWKIVLQKDSLLDILQKFVSFQVTTEKSRQNGRTVNVTRKKLIFPRFHQLDVVRKLIFDVKEYGSGRSYLVQHSAGSGKSNSIAWPAYRLASLHNADNEPVFTSVVIVTDRRNLDAQLQDTRSCRRQPGMAVSRCSRTMFFPGRSMMRHNRPIWKARKRIRDFSRIQRNIMRL